MNLKILQLPVRFLGNMKSIGLILVLFITIVSFAQKEAYLEAIEKNTIEGYNDFLKTYPESKYKNKIVAKLMPFEQPAYMDAVNRNTMESYERFLADFPMSTRKNAIQNKLEMVVYYSIQFSIDIDKLDEYLTKYPKSKYCDVVTKRIEFLKVLSIKDVNDLHAYFNTGPPDEYKKEILYKLEYYELIPKIIEKEQLYDISDVQTIVKAYILEDSDLSGKDIISRMEISRIIEIIWKTYTRLIITTNTIYLNESSLYKQLRHKQKTMIANCYYGVMDYFHFAKKLVSKEEDTEVKNFGYKILLALDYGESFLKDYSKINELELYKLVFETVYEDSKVDLISLNIPDDNVLDKQFNEFEENITFWFNLEKN